MRISTLSSREMKSSISGSETPLFEAVTYARAWLTLRENSLNFTLWKWKLDKTKHQITSIHPCLFSTLWKSWKTLSCKKITNKFRILDLNIRHEDSLLWSSVALPPAKKGFQWNSLAIVIPAHFLEDKLGEDGKSAAVHGVGNDAPLKVLDWSFRRRKTENLIVVQRPPRTFHPQLHHPPGKFCSKCSDLDFHNIFFISLLE